MKEVVVCRLKLSSYAKEFSFDLNRIFEHLSFPKVLHRLKMRFSVIEIIKEVPTVRFSY